MGGHGRLNTPAPQRPAKEAVMPTEKFITEIWKPVVGYEGLYEVSSLGRVKRVADSFMPSGGVRRKAPYLLGLHRKRNGYISCLLYGDGVRRDATVHTLVAEAFIGPRPPGMQVNHRNGIKRDNEDVNLEWCSPKENTAHAHRLGLRKNSKQRGERNGNAKLKETQVREILKLKGK